MKQNIFSLTVGIIFSLITLLHLIRVAFGWEAVIAGWIVPMWVSWIGILVSGYLSYQGLRYSKNS